MKCFPWYLIFLKRSLVFPILLFSSISLHCSLKKALLISPCYSLGLCIQLGTSCPFSLAVHFSYFLAICKASSDNHFAFLHFFFFGLVLVFFVAKDGDTLYSQQKQDQRADCGSDHELLTEKFRLKLKKIRKTTRSYINYTSIKLGVKIVRKK